MDEVEDNSRPAYRTSSCRQSSLSYANVISNSWLGFATGELTGVGRTWLWINLLQLIVRGGRRPKWCFSRSRFVSGTVRRAPESPLVPTASKLLKSP